MELTAAQKEKLHKALRGAFSLASLERMVEFKLGEKLEDIASDRNLSAAAFELIKWAESKGRTEDLVRGAFQASSDHPLLRAFIKEVLPSADVKALANQQGGDGRSSPRDKGWRLPSKPALALIGFQGALGALAVVLIVTIKTQPRTAEPTPGKPRITDVFVHEEGGRRYLIDFRVDNQGDSAVSISRLILEHVDESAEVDYEGYSHRYETNIDIGRLTGGRAEQVLAQKVKAGDTDRFGVVVRVGRKGRFRIRCWLETNYGRTEGKVLTFTAAADPRNPTIRAAAKAARGTPVGDSHAKGRLVVVDARAFLFVGPGAVGPEGTLLTELGELKGVSDFTVVESRREPTFTDQWLAVFARLLRLQSLDLVGTAVTEAGVGSLTGRARLTHLDLSRTRVGGPALVTALSGCQSLVSLVLDDTGTSDGDLLGLSRLSGLQAISLKDTAVTDAGLATLARLPGLVEVDVRSTRVSAAGVNGLLRAHPQLRIYWSSLAELDRLLLTPLHLANGWADRLEACTSLQSLELSGNPATPELLRRVGRLRTLKVLKLNQTGLDDEGVRHLAGLDRLEDLRLGDARITDAGLATLAKLTSLRRLYLIGIMGVTDDGVSKLEKALPECRVSHWRSEWGPVVFFAAVLSAGCAERAPPLRDKAAQILPAEAQLSPEGVFRTFTSASEKGRWNELWECLTSEAGEQLTVQVLFFAQALAASDEGRAASLGDLAREFGANLTPDASRQSLFSVRDRRGFFLRLCAWMRAELKQQPPEDILGYQVSKALLASVRVEGEEAVGSLRIPGLTNPPMVFRRQGSRWYIRDLSGEDGHLSPESAFYCYTDAYRGREWGRLLDAVTPASRPFLLGNAIRGAEAIAKGDEEKEASLHKVLEAHGVKEANPETLKGVADLVRCFTEVTAWAEAQSKGLQLTRLPLDARLSGLRVSGDSATGELFRKDQAKPERTLAFRKVAAKWYLDPLASPPPR